MTLEELEQLKDVILIGSRGLNVNGPDADYDFCVKKENLNEELLGIFNSGCNFDIKKYFKYLPLGNAWLMPKISLELKGYPVADIIVFENDKDFDIIQKVKDELMRLPSYYLEDKKTRVSLFEMGLKHYGFVKDPDSFNQNKKEPL